MDRQFYKRLEVYSLLRSIGKFCYRLPNSPQVGDDWVAKELVAKRKTLFVIISDAAGGL